MNIITLDFETFFDDDYSLKKMTTEAYIRDPRFKVHGVGIRWPDGDKIFVTNCRDQYGNQNLKGLADWENSAVLCHHTHFDGFILSHRYGIRPKLWLDTLSMARMVQGNHLSASLESLAKRYGLAAKNVPYNLFKGKHWHELSPDVQRQVADGCLHDVELTWQLFNTLMHGFPPEELAVIDMTTRMFTEPCLQGDIKVLAEVWTSEETRKVDLKSALGVEDADLQSSAKFAELLRAEGVEPATKTGKNGDIYAFAKTDQFMKDLLEDEGRCGQLAAARLGIKSTTVQTRAERLGYMATRGPLPVYLRYYGASTARWSGGDNLNWQNLKRGSALRQAICAPEGHKLVIADLSQIECRVLNVLAGQWDVVERFRRGEDPYLPMGSLIHGRTITKADKLERQGGKILELQAGYYAGEGSIRRAAANGTPSVRIDLETALRWKNAYRATHTKVVDYWKTGGRMISRIAGGDRMQWGPLTTETSRITGPNGAWMDYELEYHRGDDGRDGWRRKTRSGWSWFHAGILTQNICEFVSRLVLSQAMLRIKARGHKIVWCTHDDLVIVEKEDKAEYAWQVVQEELVKAPAWLPELPLACEGGVFDRYGEKK